MGIGMMGVGLVVMLVILVGAVGTVALVVWGRSFTSRNRPQADVWPQPLPEAYIR